MDAKKNFAYSTVATAPSPATSGLTLVVAAAEGARFPAPPFNLVVWAAGAVPTPANSEIVRVTGVATDTLTFSRQAEGSANRSVVVGDQVAAAITEKDLGEPGARDVPLYDVFVPAGRTLLVGRGLKTDGNITVDGEVATI